MMALEGREAGAKRERRAGLVYDGSVSFQACSLELARGDGVSRVIVSTCTAHNHCGC